MTPVWILAGCLLLNSISSVESELFESSQIFNEKVRYWAASREMLQVFASH